MQGAQQEQLRQQYLAAMGVTSWLPVRPLPGAASSPVWHWADAQQPAVGSPVPRPEKASVDPQVPGRARADIKQLLAETSSPSPSPSAKPARQMPVAEPAPGMSAPAPAPAPEADPQVQDDSPATATPKAVPRFRLAMVRYQDCLVVDELPMQSLQGFSPAHRELLGRILRSVGLGQGEPQVQAFAWPLVNAPHVDQSEPVAREGVKAVLWRFQQGATLPLLLLGEKSAHYVLKEDQDRAMGAWSEQDDHWHLVSYSLGELLRVPGRKRELWQHLQPLRRRS